MIRTTVGRLSAHPGWLARHDDDASEPDYPQTRIVSSLCPSGRPLSDHDLIPFRIDGFARSGNVTDV